MWKLVSVFLVAFLSASSAQTVDLECLFNDNFGTYNCQLFEIEATDPNVEYNFVGEHLQGRTDDDVESVEIIASNTPFIISEIFTTFPNIVELDIRNSSLESIEFPATHTLRQIYINNNNIERIENGTFGTQSNLTLINLVRNNISFIDEDAFTGLTHVDRIILIGNRITQLPGRIFANIPTLAHLDLENNNLTRIEAETFAESNHLYRIYLEYNEITAIAPTFIRTLSPNLEYINLNGNECVRRSFLFDDEFDQIMFHQSLQDCYDEFSPRAPTDDRVMTMQFTGQLSVFDDFGNVIAIINQGSDNGTTPETTTSIPDTTTEVDNGTTTIESETTTEENNETTVGS